MKDHLDQFIRLSIWAVKLYRDGELSFRKATKLAGLDRWEMVQLLNEKRRLNPFTHVLDVEKDLKTLKKRRINIG